MFRHDILRKIDDDILKDKTTIQDWKDVVNSYVKLQYETVIKETNTERRFYNIKRKRRFIESMYGIYTDYEKVDGLELQKKMRVLLIQPKGSFMLRGITHPVCRDLMMTATFLKDHGFEVRVWNRCIDSSDQIHVKDDFYADAAVIFISQSSSVKDAIVVSQKLRKRGVIVLWADMVSLLSIDFLGKEIFFDYLLLGEYCITTEELLRSIRDGGDGRDIDGVAYPERNRIVQNPRRPLPDFSLIPPIDWSLIDVERCFRRFPGCERMLYLNASVGCPFSCGFCSTPACYGKRRKRPIEYVIKEIDYLVQEHGLDGINFSDELLFFTNEELIKLRECRERNGGRFVWGGETRPQIMTKELLQAMYEAGCRWLLLGLETGADEIRTKISKEYDSDYVKKVVDWCTELGIATFGSFIIGYPEETEQNLRDTVCFALSLNLDAFLFNYFVMIPETPLYREAVKKMQFHFNSIYDFNKLVNTDILFKNLSSIPYVELATVKAYFDYLTITRKKKTSEKGTAGSQFFKKAVNTAMEYLRNSPREAVIGLYNVARRGSSVFYYPLTHPGIRKKYGLRNINKN